MEATALRTWNLAGLAMILRALVWIVDETSTKRSGKENLPACQGPKGSLLGATRSNKKIQFLT